jgi:hypothetical protein
MAAISAQFTADFSQFTAAADGAVASLGGVQAAAEGIDLNAQAEQAGRAMVDFGRTVQTFASEYITAFAEEEAATARLTSALQASGNATPAVIAQYAAMAEQFQTTTRYSDDAVTAAQTVLTQIGQIGPEQMAPAMQAAVDLAASLGIGLPEAAKKIATVIGSDGAKLGTLAKYLGDVDLKGKSSAEMIAIFLAKFGGSAAADLATVDGQLASLNNKFDDFKGKVGKVLAEALTPLLEAFTRLSPTTQTLILGVGGLLIALAPVAIAFGTLVTAIGPLIPLIATVIPAALGSLAVLMGPAGLVVAAILAVYVAFKNWDAIVGIVSSVYNAIKTYLVDQFNALVGAILRPINAVSDAFKGLYDKVVGRSYVPDLVAGIAAEFGKLDAIMVQPAVSATEAVGDAIGGMVQGAMNQFSLLISDPNMAGFFGLDPKGSVANTLWGGGQAGITPEMAAAMAAGQFINTAGVGAVHNTFNISQPLGTPDAIAKAVNQALTPRIMQGAKLSGS